MESIFSVPRPIDGCAAKLHVGSEGDEGMLLPAAMSPSEGLPFLSLSSVSKRDSGPWRFTMELFEVVLAILAGPNPRNASQQLAAAGHNQG